MVRGWSFPITLEPTGRVALFQQIARAIAADVLRGRLRPGDRLPGSRRLAGTLGVHRSTVVTAYAELVAQGWAATRARGATFIAETSPDLQAGKRTRPRPARGIAAEAGFVIGAMPAPHLRAPSATPAVRGTLALWGGVPDLRLLPLVPLGRALRRVTRQGGRQLLAYTAERAGHGRLREQLARLLATTRGLPAGADDVFITQGSQMALDLIARALVQPGDRVAVEALGYRPAWGAFERAGARLVPIAVDGEGLVVDQLQAACAAGALRAVYVTPHHQYPTTVMLSPRRRSALLALATQHALAVVEDDYDHEFHYDGRPLLPLASADGGRQVIYVGSLAKILAPGLRIGFVVAARSLLARLGEERALLDRQGNHLIEAALAELLEDGEVERHARRVRRIYQRRRDVLFAALQRQLGGAVQVALPPGGMALWAKVAPDVNVERWQERAQAAGVLFQAGSTFAFEPPTPKRPLAAMRLGFAVCDERELELAVQRLARSLPRR
jgi:GntR family transcriptional regulator/MocR family aminotransferase